MNLLKKTKNPSFINPFQETIAKQATKRNNSFDLNTVEKEASSQITDRKINKPINFDKNKFFVQEKKRPQKISQNTGIRLNDADNVFYVDPKEKIKIFFSTPINTLIIFILFIISITLLTFLWLVFTKPTTIFCKKIKN